MWLNFLITIWNPFKNTMTNKYVTSWSIIVFLAWIVIFRWSQFIWFLSKITWNYLLLGSLLRFYITLDSNPFSINNIFHNSRSRNTLDNMTLWLFISLQSWILFKVYPRLWLNWLIFIGLGVLIFFISLWLSKTYYLRLLMWSLLNICHC